MIALAEASGSETIAEGVENDAELHVLATLGCDFIQGYLLSRPLKEPDLLQFLNEKRVHSVG